MRTQVRKRGVATLIVVAIATLLAVTACGSQAANSGAGRPPLLHLSSASTAEGIAVGAPARVGAYGGEPEFVLHASLASGTPPPAPVWWPNTATKQAADRIASALSAGSTTTAVVGGWVARIHHADLLTVHNDGSWSVGLDCSPTEPLVRESLAVMCATATGSGVATVPHPIPPPPVRPIVTPMTGTRAPVRAPVPAPVPMPPVGPTTQRDRQIAISVVTAIDGVAPPPGAVTVTFGAPITTVTVDRFLGTTRTSGWATTLGIDEAGVVRTASGWLPGATKGQRYPLISATDAYGLLQNRPRPLVAEVCMIRRDGKHGCATPPPTVITGASLGLLLDHDGNRTILVPAWLFSVQGADPAPLAQIAIDPSYLAPPSPLDVGGVNSGVNTASPNAIPPATATSEPAGGAPASPPPAKPPAESPTSTQTPAPPR